MDHEYKEDILKALETPAPRSSRRGYKGQGAVTVMFRSGWREGVCEECHENTNVIDAMIDWQPYTVCAICGPKIVDEVFNP
jgi:hypothetical protein